LDRSLEKTRQKLGKSAGESGGVSVAAVMVLKGSADVLVCST